jgi:hypothetical protein
MHQYCSVCIYDEAHTNFQGWKSCAVTTLGRGGSDLTATTIGKALGLREIQVCFLF